MTVPNETNRINYPATGSENTVPYTFRIFDETELKVYLTNPDGLSTLQVLGSDYTVDGVMSYTGGNVIFATDPTINYIVSILRQPANTQDTSLQDQSAYSPTTVENALDLLTMQVQALQGEVDRSIKIPVSEAGTPTIVDLPTADNRALMPVGFDSFGNVTTVAEITNTTVSSAMIPVVTAATLAVARAAMGPWGDALVTSTGSTAARDLAHRFGEQTNVKDFGALGDGATDDTVAIRAALSSAISTGKDLFFPPGTYVMNGNGDYDEVTFGNLYISSATGLNLIGSGPGVTTIKNGSSTHGGIRFSGCTYFGIYGLTIEQNGGSGFGLNFGGQYGRVENVNIQNIVHSRGADTDISGIALIVPGSTLCTYKNILIDTVSNGIYCGYSATAPDPAPTQYHTFDNVSINATTDGFGIKLRYGTECIFNSLYFEETRCSYIVMSSCNGCRFNDFSCEADPTGAAMTATMYVSITSCNNTSFNGIMWHHGSTSITGRNLFDLGEAVTGFSVRDMYVLANQSIAELFKVSAVSTFPINVTLDNINMTIAGGKTVTAITLGVYNSFSGSLLSGANCKAAGSQIQVLNAACDVYVTTGSNRSIFVTVGSGAAIYADTVVQTGCTKYIYDDTAAADTTPTTIFAGHPIQVTALRIAGNQVVVDRQTGWTVATGTPLRTTFDTSTVTVSQLAQRFMALEQDLITHGLIGS